MGYTIHIYHGHLSDQDLAVADDVTSGFDLLVGYDSDVYSLDAAVVRLEEMKEELELESGDYTGALISEDGSDLRSVYFVVDEGDEEDEF